mmetsp:Transcript_19597/g.40927  ORF Transcript_19597/g.40927 Transcript_19597/m.40927 type:complete len:255 (+) Transcript_19597:485-1249(+)
MELANIGVDPDTFLDYSVGIFEAVWDSLNIMRMMLTQVAAFALVSWLVVWSISKVLEGSSLQKSAEIQFGQTHTYRNNQLLEMDEFEDPLRFERNRIAIQAITVLAQTGYWMASSSVQWLLCMHWKHGYVLTGLVLHLQTIFVFSYYELRGEKALFNGAIASALSTIGCALGVVAALYFIITHADNDERTNLAGIAGNRAAHFIAKGSTPGKLTITETLKMSLLSRLPPRFTNFVMLFYVIAIFNAFKAYNNNI